MGSTPTFGREQVYNGAWLSMVEHRVRDAEVGGSNPLAPTNKRIAIVADTSGIRAYDNLAV